MEILARPGDTGEEAHVRRIKCGLEKDDWGRETVLGKAWASSL